jgi:uncharacterized protein (TIGR03435 family)
MRLFATAVLFTLTCGRAIAQADDPGIVFEAASIKPFPEGTPISMSGCLGGPGSNDPGLINCEYVTLKTLLMRAYEVKNQEIFGPGWLDNTHFNLTLKVPSGSTKDQMPLMFRNLLAERFKVAVHRENRLLTGYALTVAKGGLKIKESAPPDAAAADEPPAGGKLPIGSDGFPILRRSTIAGGPITLYREGRARLQAGNTKLTTLASALGGQLDRIVTDETGLDGKYDITLNWTPDTTEPGGRSRQTARADANALPEASTPAVDLFAAVEQQLGLKLVAKKVSRDTIVVDRAEKVPTEN